MGVPFTHLHVHTQYSLLDGASKPEELLRRAMELGMDSIAITDHGNMYGAVDLYQTAQKLSKEAEKQGKPGIRVIIGCEVYLTPGSRFCMTDIMCPSASASPSLSPEQMSRRSAPALVCAAASEQRYPSSPLFIAPATFFDAPLSLSPIMSMPSSLQH